jgi:outer membrane protein OmpA-like peptidoglycan-associated protein
MNNFLAAKTSLVATAVACALLAACSAAPTKPDGAAGLRSRLTQLQADTQLGALAPLAMKEADVAVSAAEQPQADKVLGAHLVFLADRKIEIARSVAASHYAVDQRKLLGEQRDAMRLQARTNEADSANRRAEVATVDASNQKMAADSANRRAEMAAADATEQKRDADAARDATATAQSSAVELQRQLAELQAKVTDRGLVITLGDVLFASGTAELNSGGNNHLGKLAGFLNKYPDRTTLIEGYTDSVGSNDYNQGLSQRRAEAVKSYLVAQGIDASRVTASGKGESNPVGNNASVTGRQQNRRVEVIIANTPQLSLR